ncbi:2-phospho-L-lactate transferase [Halovenus rubra]|uniref:2-phospho-L-lactate transferase n=2 Tax=Halovenus rubra TaxID=869890 RepID=A0ABD5XCH8_9EURY|nr:2-phospho-L-lactate transferase [Halovenus rubra]
MVTFLSGGTGTPKLLSGSEGVFPPAETTVVANTGDDVELGGFLVCPDVDTVLFLGGDKLNRDTWWGIAEDTAQTHQEIQRLATEADLGTGPRYLDPEKQTQGREIARWRRFSGVGEFMHIGDQDRAVHLTRTGLLDEGQPLTEVTGTLCEVFDVPFEVLPMSDDPVSTLIETPDRTMHFQEFWVARGGDPTITGVEFRGAEHAQPTSAVRDALDNPVIIGPSNPVTSIGPMLALDGFEEALESTPVVAVSPFVEDEVFSGPAGKLMDALGYDSSTAGMAEAYPFADGFVLDTEDSTNLDRPVVRTDTHIESKTDASRVSHAVQEMLYEIR